MDFVPNQTRRIRIVVGDGNELSIKRLLHVFQVLYGILQHDLIIKSILEGVGIILLGKIRGIKEVMVAPLFVGCITVPEASGISVKTALIGKSFLERMKGAACWVLVPP